VNTPRILVIRLSSLGDVVLTGAVYRNLKAHWPGAKITVLTKPAFAPFLEGHPAVDEVLVFRGLFQAVREIRLRAFTHVLDLHATWRSFWLSSLSGAPERLRYRKDALARRLYVWARRPSPSLERHTLDRYLECLRPWGVPIRHRGPELSEWGRRSAAPRPSFRSVVVIQTAFLGDAMLTIPLLKRTRSAFPSAHLTVVCRPETAEVFRAAGADEVIEDPKRGASRPSRVLALAKSLRGRDLALIPHRSFRSALTAALAGIPRRVGFGRSAGRWLLTDRVPFSWLLHDAERNLSLLSPFTDAAAGADPSAPGEPSIAAAAGSAQAEAMTRDLKRPIIGLHPGSVWATKRWLAPRFAQLAAELARETGGTVVLIGGASDAETAAAIERDSGGACLNWVGRTDLKELLSVVARFDLFITNDSGPMHVATAFGVPTLALFGPTTRELGFFPYGEGHEVLEAPLACRPCGLHGARTCPEGHFLCMKLITVDQALEAARRLLARSRERASA
jgi:heptosyltransferase-2